MSPRTVLWVLAALGQPGCAAATAAAPHDAAGAPPHAAETDAFRREVPPPGRTPQVAAPEPTRATLPGGLSVWSVAKPGLPLVHVTAVIRSGSAADPTDAPGLASFTAEMLRLGTASRDAAALAEAVESRGASLDVEVDEDSISLSMTALAQNFEPLLDVLADVLQNSSFPPAEVERLRKQRAAALAQRQDAPEFAAAELFRASVFGPHPYGHLPSGSVAANAHVDRAALAGFAAAHVRPANVAIVVVGDVTAPAAAAAVTARLGHWRGASGVQPKPTAPTAQRPEVVLLPRPAAPQSQVVVGTLGAAHDDPRYFALVLCNEIFGGMFNSRLNMNLREDKGYTYGARSAFDFMRARGPWLLSSSIRTDATEAAIHEIFAELAGMRDAEVTAEELTAAKSRVALSLPDRFQTVGRIANMMATIYAYDLPPDYYRQLPARLAAVDAAQILAAAREIFRPEAQTIVVVGDRERVQTGLEDLHRGPVRVPN